MERTKQNTSTKRNFKQDESVHVSRLGDGKIYRAIIKGLHSQLNACLDFYIIEWIDTPAGIEWTHSVMIETCIDRPAGFEDYNVLLNNHLKFWDK